MRQVLHILTKPHDALARAMVQHEQSLPDHKIETVDLTKPSPDYNNLVAKLFQADSIQVW